MNLTQPLIRLILPALSYPGRLACSREAGDLLVARLLLSQVSVSLPL